LLSASTAASAPSMDVRGTSVIAAVRRPDQDHVHHVPAGRPSLLPEVQLRHGRRYWAAYTARSGSQRYL